MLFVFKYFYKDLETVLDITPQLSGGQVQRNEAPARKCAIIKLGHILVCEEWTAWACMIVADVLVPNRCQHISSNHAYHQTSNIRLTFVNNKIVNHSDVVGDSPVGAAPTTSSFSM